MDTIQINERELRKLISEMVRRILNEREYYDGDVEHIGVCNVLEWLDDMLLDLTDKILPYEETMEYVECLDKYKDDFNIEATIVNAKHPDMDWQRYDYIDDIDDKSVERARKAIMNACSANDGIRKTALALLDKIIDKLELEDFENY